MNKERFIRISSWALIFGAITLTLGTIAITWLGFSIRRSLAISVQEPAVTLAMNLAWLGALLLAIGMLGLLYRYGDEVGRFGKGALAIGAIGCFLVATGAPFTIDVFNEVLGEVWIVIHVAPMSHAALNGYRVFLLSGLGVLYLTLVVFGVTALIRKPLPRWNWLPILAGFVPLMIASDTVLAEPLRFFSFPYSGNTFGLSIALGVSISAVMLVLLGYILQTDTHQDSAIA